MRSCSLTLVTVLTLSFASAANSQTEQTKLLRFPDVHGDTVVFTYAGDLWTAPTAGGTAIRLTAHPGQELFARFSPDGKWIAFTGQYDGDEQVYVMPAGGGIPRQLTFYPARGPLAPRWGYDNQVYGWTPDGSAVLFRSLRDGWDLSDSKLYTVPPTGGLPTALPMPVSGAGTLSPDGRKVVYSPLFRDFRAWKRYEGGWAQELYIFDLDSHDTVNISNHPRADRDPMWIGDTIYFTSDRDGTLNIYAYDTSNGSLSQITRSDIWDVRWPSDDGAGMIVYELGGSLQLLDINTGRSQDISIHVPDDGLAMRASNIPVSGNIENYAIGPEGKRAIFIARGDVFTVPAEHGPTRNLTRSSDAHDKAARWSPDGKYIAFLSDMSGDDELYIINQDGSGEPQKLTSMSTGMLYAPEWSPDSRMIAFSDKEGGLYLVTVENKRVVKVTKNPAGRIGDYTWSPRSGHMAFSLSDPTGFSSIYIWSVADHELRRVTGEYFNEFSPAWGSDGNHLYYLADRELAPQLGSFEWNYVVDRESYIYVLALRKDVPHPFGPESDEVTIKDEEEEKEDEEKEQEDEEAPIKIDFDGLAERVARVPVGADNYGGLGTTEGHLWYVRGTPSYYGRGAGSAPAIMVYSLKEKKESTFAEGVGGGTISPDGSKVLLRHGGAFKIADASPGGFSSAKTVSTRGLRVDRVPAQEWEQIFDEVWRRFRDFFYVENMHGLDWEAVREQYRPLLEHVAHRSDLNYVIGEMIAELSVSHAYIVGGDYEVPPRPPIALSGARFTLDERSGLYRISKIFKGDNAEDRYRSPLTEIGMNVEVSSYLLAINGESITGEQNPYEMLGYKTGSPVTFTINSRPSMEGSRDVTFNPLTSELSLKYMEWVEKNRERVNRMTEGRVGYLHIPDMGVDGIREFIKWYYGQIRKEGLVIDVRGNGGGNVSAMLINRLARDLISTGYSRTSEFTGTYPDQVFIGHMVCLLNETSASDGDIFPYSFREAGLGPLIGKRSWGGVVGYTGSGPLIDGGSCNVPQFGFADAEGNWAVEGYGVEPDIEVENDPKSILEGRDLQLERGIDEVMRMIRENPRSLPGRPADPVKKKR